MAAKQKTVKKEKVQTIIYGIHPIVELLKAKKRKLYMIYTTRPTPKAWGLIEKLLTKDVQIQYVTRDIIAKIAQTTDHQSVAAVVGPFQIRKKFFEPTKSPFLIMLDGIQDPRNLGAILRSSYCVGASGVILISRGASPINSVALKSSAGLAEHLEIYEAPSAKFAAIELEKAGYNLYVATLGGKSSTEVTYTLPLCIVIGSEGAGVSKDILPYGQQVLLPQRTSDISYNASVAAGILLFTVATQNKLI